jgi:hypothetical protein
MGWPASTRANFRRKFSCTYSPPIAPIAASAYTHRLLYHAYFLAGRPSNPASAACILAGGHRNSVELRPSRNPSLKSSETMPSWGRRCQPTARALRRCAAYVATTFYSLLSLPLCCPCCDHVLLFTFYSLLPIPLCRLRCDHTITSYFPIAILRAGRHEFVGNRGESEIRAHLRGCAIPHTRRVPLGTH